MFCSMVFSRLTSADGTFFESELKNFEEGRLCFFIHDPPNDSLIDI